ncbi:type VI secretion system domain-containing protein [Helicobacter sp. T3_23-1056]
MCFCNHLGENLEHLETYHLLENEMSKYKTLNHESIKWDKVYEYCLEILQNFSMDMKICNYFVLSCVALKQNFDMANNLFVALADILQNEPNNLYKQPSDLKNQKKKLKNIIESFIIEVNNLNLLDSAQVENFNRTFQNLSKLLECEFQPIYTREQPRKNDTAIVSSQQAESKSPNAIALHKLSDREYRDFLNNLAFEILERDIGNPNAYAMFIEAMWGKIKTLPPHSQNITQIKYPSQNLIQMLDSKRSNALEQIKLFMSNLTLNPFWIEGLKRFCDFLQEQKLIDATNLLQILVGNFLTKFKEIANLKFIDGESMCESRVYEYFVRQNIKVEHKADKNDKNKEKSMNLNDILLDMEAKNSDNSPSSQINALMKMANAFEEKNMKNNAKILYIQLKDLMEKTLLKDYLTDDYLKIKSKSQKI